MLAKFRRSFRRRIVSAPAAIRAPRALRQPQAALEIAETPIRTGRNLRTLLVEDMGRAAQKEVRERF